MAEKFSLDADPRNNYVNMILNDMKNFDYWIQRNDDLYAGYAFRTLVFDLPPSGQKYLKDVMEKVVRWSIDTSVLGSCEVLLENYQKVMAWVWPNILQEYALAKPRNPQPTTLGET